MVCVESQLPTLAGRYHLRELIGQGGMGAVYLADDDILGRRVAIKRIISTVGDDDDREHALSRLIREARSAARIHHPNIVTVHDVLTVGDQTYVIMEYVEAVNLSQLIRKQGQLSPQRTAALGAQIAGALQAAHRLGVIHRDVKPANILVADEDQAKLADFGVALASDDPRLTSAGNLVGSVLFMAPEVAQGGPATPASDLYSLGATLFNAVEGHAPFGATNSSVSAAAVLTQLVSRPAPPTSRGGPAAGIINALLRSDPAQRPTAEQARRALLAAATSPILDPTRGGPAAPPAPPPPSPQSFSASPTRFHEQAASPAPSASVTTAAPPPIASAAPPPSNGPAGPPPSNGPGAAVTSFTAASAPAPTTTPQKTRTRRPVLIVGAIVAALILATTGIVIAYQATFWDRFAGQGTTSCPGPVMNSVSVKAADGTLTTSIIGQVNAPDHSLTVYLSSGDSPVNLGWYSWSYFTQSGKLVVVADANDYQEYPAPAPSIHNGVWRVAIPLEKFPHYSPVRAAVELTTLDAEGAGTKTESCQSDALVFG